MAGDELHVGVFILAGACSICRDDLIGKIMERNDIK